MSACNLAAETAARLDAMDARISALFALMAEATEAAGLAPDDDDGSVYVAAASIQARRAQFHVVRTEGAL